MEKENTTMQQPDKAAQLKDLIGRLVSTAEVINKNIADSEAGTVWPYAKSLNDRVKTICTVVLGENSSDMNLIDMLSAMFTIERDIILSGWTDEITGKIADALTFDEADFDKNENVCAYFFDLCAYVSHALEMKSYIEGAPEEETEIKAMLDDLKPVLETLENISNACAA